MNPSITLSTTPFEYPSMDYALLQREGIKLLEHLDGQIWSDFNAHDPGITILEQLCYAITDLSYRINYDIKDLLSGGQDAPYDSLYSPAQVLTTHPVTLLDLRKLLIDIAGVKNAWVEPASHAEVGLVYDPSELTLYLKGELQPLAHRQALSPRGLYHVLIEADDGPLGVDTQEIVNQVNKRLLAHRSLCEDFLPPQVLPRQAILVQASIEISAVEDPAQLLLDVYQSLASTISPNICFYTLSELLEQGKSIDEIFDGPPLKQGFIDSAELQQFQRKTGLRSSDLLEIIMNVTGVMTVTDITITDDLAQDDLARAPQDWYFKLDPEKTPWLDVQNLQLTLTRGGIQIPLDEITTNAKEKYAHQQKNAGYKPPLPLNQLDIQLAAGKDRQTEQYYSLQHQFPALYGIASMGLPESASAERKAQSKQLKAYLLFFDQILANYFAQLGNAKALFSFYPKSANKKSHRTYFSQYINDSELGLEEVVTRGLAEKLADITDREAKEKVLPAGRKHRFLNHLLARFAEQFSDFALFATLDDGDLIEDKCAFLQDYPAIGSARGSGFDYTQASWNSRNVSGLEKRISLKLGISSYLKRDLAGPNGLKETDEGGFHLLEHILLRPRAQDNEQTSQYGITGQTAWLDQPLNADPYSHQISFILPNWIARFQNPEFMQFISTVLREETPAHIQVHLHWVDEKTMESFESAQKTWLKSAISLRLWAPDSHNQYAEHDRIKQMRHLELKDARDKMLHILGIGQPYPLRDVQLSYVTTVAAGMQTDIHLLGGQAGVHYQLCDEDGNPIADEEGESFSVSPTIGHFELPPQALESAQAIKLKTPKIIKDITFTILARPVSVDGTTGLLESYLTSEVAIKLGIDKTLKVLFEASEGQMVNDQQARVITDYNSQVKVNIMQSQQGISYRLVTADDSPLSTDHKGDTKTITLTSNIEFKENTQIYIQAYRSKKLNTKIRLDTSLTIWVRPNTSIPVMLEKPIVDYQGVTKLTLGAPQDGVEYHLFKRLARLEIALQKAEYLSERTIEDSLVDNPETLDISIQKLPRVTDWKTQTSFEEIGQFIEEKNRLSISSGELLEDSLFIIRASKKDNDEQLQLEQAVAVLVRPSTAPVVSVKDEFVTKGRPGEVQVSSTQQGVHYQLRLNDVNKTKIDKNPGYHYQDRGISTARIGVDFRIEESDQPILEVLLPTEAITRTTEFTVMAIKAITGVSAQLAQTATLKVIDNNPASPSLSDPDEENTKPADDNAAPDLE